MRWDSTKPSKRDMTSDVAKHMRSLQSDLDNWLQNVFYWSDSAASGGYVRESVTSDVRLTGRVHYAPESQVSFTNRSGEIQLDSTNRRLKVLTGAGSDDSVIVGSAQMVASYLTMGGTQNNEAKMIQNTKVVIESGIATCPVATPSSLSTSVPFSSAYGAPPIVYVTSGTTDPARSPARFMVGTNIIETSGFTAVAHYVGSGTTENDVMWFWRSIGTKSL